MFNRVGNWTQFNKTHVLDFPRLTLEHLRELTFGVYKDNLALSYIVDKMQTEETENIYFDEIT